MDQIILPIIGPIIIGIGLATLINPNFTRWINLPGDARSKVVVSVIIGTILLILSFTI